MYQRILSDPLLFPPDMPADAMSVITGLLQRDPSKRLGSNGAEEIKRHPFFSKHIDWNRYVPLACLEDWRVRRGSEARPSSVLQVSLLSHDSSLTGALRHSLCQADREEDPTSIQTHCGTSPRRECVELLLIIFGAGVRAISSFMQVSHRERLDAVTVLRPRFR